MYIPKEPPRLTSAEPYWIRPRPTVPGLKPPSGLAPPRAHVIPISADPLGCQRARVAARTAMNDLAQTAQNWDWIRGSRRLLTHVELNEQGNAIRFVEQRYKEAVRLVHEKCPPSYRSNFFDQRSDIGRTDW